MVRRRYLSEEQLKSRKVRRENVRWAIGFILAPLVLIAAGYLVSDIVRDVIRDHVLDPFFEQLKSMISAD